MSTDELCHLWSDNSVSRIAEEFNCTYEHFGPAAGGQKELPLEWALEWPQEQPEERE